MGAGSEAEPYGCGLVLVGQIGRPIMQNENFSVQRKPHDIPIETHRRLWSLADEINSVDIRARKMPISMLKSSSIFPGHLEDRMRLGARFFPPM
jgi:hypothetical protein